MQQEPPDKFGGLQCDYLFPTISVILHGETDLITLDALDAAVCNGYTVRVAAQVGYDL